MSRNLYLFIAFCMLGYVSGAGIRIGNELKNKKLLWMRCWSKNDVLGPETIPIGQHFLNKFEVNFWGTTRFMCTLKQGPNFRHYQNFTAFKLFSVMDLGGLWDWRAREDGIYLKKEGGDHIMNPVNMHKAYDWIY